MPFNDAFFIKPASEDYIRTRVTKWTQDQGMALDGRLLIEDYPGGVDENGCPRPDLIKVTFSTYKDA